MDGLSESTFFHDPELRARKQLIEGIMIRSYWGEQLTLAVVDLEPDTLLPNHSHPNEQGGIILEGEIDFTIAGKTKRLKTGDLYLIPANVEHSVKTNTDPVRILDIFSPVREDFKY
jgi:quercetin dioxygenase-like cupin family protein